MLSFILHGTPFAGSKLASHKPHKTENLNSIDFLEDMSSHTKRKAWKLIDEAGLRGYAVGGASMSQKHCNFMKCDDRIRPASFTVSHQFSPINVQFCCIFNSSLKVIVFDGSQNYFLKSP